MLKIVKTLVVGIMILVMATGCVGVKYATTTELDAKDFIVDEPNTTYRYEIVDAVIDDFTRTNISDNIFATFWQATVSYKPYNIIHKEQGELTNLFEAPSLFDKEIGDTVKVTIAKKYVNGELDSKQIVKIH